MKAIERLKINLIVMSILLIVFLVISTGGSVKSGVDLKALSAQLIETMQDGGKMQEEGAMELKGLYGLSANDYEQAVLYAPVSNMDVAELLLIECKNEAQTEAVEKAMEQRLETQTRNFESYGVEQMALIKKTVADVKGTYCVYICSISSSEAEEIFLNGIQ